MCIRDRIKPINELTLKASFGIDRNYQRREVYMPKTTLYGEKAVGRADIGQYDRSDYLLELTANYAKRLGDHNPVSYTHLDVYKRQPQASPQPPSDSNWLHEVSSESCAQSTNGE